MSSHYSAEGTLVLSKDTEIRTLDSGKSVINLSFSPYMNTKDLTDEQKDARSLWINVSLWDEDAASVYDLLSSQPASERGARSVAVSVSGTLQGNNWVDDEGNRRSGLELRFPTVAALIRGAKVKVEKAQRTEVKD